MLQGLAEVPGPAGAPWCFFTVPSLLPGFRPFCPLTLPTPPTPTPTPTRRYLKFDLGDGQSLAVRCTIDAAVKLGDATQLAAVHALNEFDPKWAGERAARGAGGAGSHVAEGEQDAGG